MRNRRYQRRNERGFALVYVAVTVTLLCLCAGLAVDSGRAYMVKAQLTKAVDGAALGAARMLNSANPRTQAVEIFHANYPQGYYGTSGDPTTAPDFFDVTTNEADAVNVVTVTATGRTESYASSDDGASTDTVTSVN